MVGDVHVVDHDELFDGTHRLTVFRTGTGGQTYRVRYDPVLMEWRIDNVLSGHHIRPWSRIGRKVVNISILRLQFVGVDMMP